MAQLPTNIVAGDPNHIAHHNKIHRYINDVFVDVTDFGAVADWNGTTGTDNTAAFAAAIAALPATGGIVYADGWFLVTGIVVKDKPILIRGAGGRSQARSSAPYAGSRSKIASVTNAPILWFTETNYASIDGLYSGAEDIAIEGLRTAGTSQVGLKVDNRGATFRDMDIAACGGPNVLIVDCVAGLFENITSHHGNLQGWLLDPTQGTDAANSAVTDNTFVNCDATSNDNQGWVLQGTVWGNSWLGGDVESNGIAGSDPGIYFAGAGGGFPRFNKMRGMWDELNGGACIRFDAGALDNEIEYVRYSSAVPSYGDAWHGRNLVHGSNIGAAADAQKIKHTFGHIMSSGGLSSSDLDAVVIRNRTDADDGNLRLSSIAFTFGTAVAMGGLFPVTGAGSVPSFVDAGNYPNNRGLTWRNAAGNANIAGLRVDANDDVYLGPGLAAGKRVVLGGPILLPNQAPTTLANGEIWYDGTDFKVRTGGATKTITIV